MQNTQLEVKRGGEKQSDGDYEVSYRVGPAKGMYEFSAGTLEWKEPQEQNVHVDVFVNDVQNGRFIPGLHVVGSLLDSRGGQAASAHLPFVWDPEQYHYGANVKVPESGAYMLQVHIFPATFKRTNKEKGKRFIADAHVAFDNVQIDV